MGKSNYQFNYTENAIANIRMYDVAERQNKANKIISVLKDYWNDLSPLSLLDMSCSTGLLTKTFSPAFREVHGIDIDEQAVAFARKHNTDDHVQFHVMDALKTEYPRDRFHIIICNQMYEHVADTEALMREIHRLLVPGGVCYFGATSRLKIMETHYGRLPFLSWLPKALAHRYLRLLGKGEYYYETLYSYWGLKRLVEDFLIIDYTIKVIAHPEKFHLTDMLQRHTLKHRMVMAIARMAYPFLPGYIWLLKKTKT